MTTPIAILRRSLAPAVLLLALAACGETPQVQQASASPLTASTVSVKKTGDAAIAIKDGTVTWRLDDARLLQVGMTVHSTASASQTVTIRASIYDAAGHLVGDASGGSLNVKPNGDATVQLSGPAPNGTIASATFEISTVPSPT